MQQNEVHAFLKFGQYLLPEKCRYWLHILVSTAPTIWEHAQKFLRSFNNNYYGPVVSDAWVMPKLTSDHSSENLTFQHSITHCAQKNEGTPMKLA